MNALSEARRELAEWDPFDAPIESLTVDEKPSVDEPSDPSDSKTKKGRPKGRTRGRDMSESLRIHIGREAAKHEYASRPRWMDEDIASVPHEKIVELANRFNCKVDIVASAWRCFRNKEVPVADRARCEREASALRRLEPLRHLIALAHDPAAARPGELDAALEGLSTHPAMGVIAADIALAIDLAGMMRELSAKAKARLFDLYTKLVADEPTISSLTVNFARDHRAVNAIYPPGETPAEHA